MPIFEFFDGHTVLVAALVTSLLYASRTFVRYRAVSASVGNLPGQCTIISRTAFISNVLPPIRGIVLGASQVHTENFQIFKSYNWDIITHISLFPKVHVTIVLSGASAIKEVIMNRTKWPRAVEVYDLINFYGRNIIATEGDEWKKHRKVSAPAFTDRNNRFLWEETLRVLQDLLDNVWGNHPSFSYNHSADMTMPLTLFIISGAGFGKRINFTSADRPPPGYTMTFKEAIHEVAINIMTRAVLPSWLYKLSAKGRHIDKAFSELDQYLLEMIDTRRNAAMKEERHDLLSGLLDANEEETKDGQLKLTQSELTGDIFAYLIAGHETSGNTLVWAFALLSLYPEEQDKLYKHVKSVMPEGRQPAYGDMASFTHTLAVIYETLRLFPVVIVVNKEAGEDTVLTAMNTETGEKRVIPLPKGTSIVINNPGLHHNPEHWKDSYAFKPERFLDPKWPKEAFLPFSGGAHGCIGRKFAETELVAILSVIIFKYTIHIKDEPEFANETFEQKKTRVLRGKQGLTHEPVRVPLTFKRRA